MSHTRYQLTPDQRTFYNEHGYLIIENAMNEIGLPAVRAAYERTEAELKPAWEESGIGKSIYMQLSNPIDFFSQPVSQPFMAENGTTA